MKRLKEQDKERNLRHMGFYRCVPPWARASDCTVIAVADRGRLFGFLVGIWSYVSCRAWMATQVRISEYGSVDDWLQQQSEYMTPTNGPFPTAHDWHSLPVDIPVWGHMLPTLLKECIGSLVKPSNGDSHAKPVPPESDVRFTADCPLTFRRRGSLQP